MRADSSWSTSTRGGVIVRSSQKAKLKVKTEICASMALFFFLLLLLLISDSFRRMLKFVVDLTTTIEPSNMHAQSILTIYFYEYFPMKREEKFHLSCISWSDVNMFIQCPKCFVLSMVLCSHERLHSTCVNWKTIALVEKITKTDTLIFSYANVK